MFFKFSKFIRNSAIKVFLFFQNLMCHFIFIFLMSLPRHLLHQSIKLFSKNFHSFLCLISNFFSIFELILQQFFQFFILFFDFLILHCFLHQRIDIACMSWHISLVPVIINEIILQNTNFGLLLLMFFDEFFKLCITKF